MAKHEPSDDAVSLMPEQIVRSILVVRGHKVLLDSQLASFYGVETKVLNQAVKRNQERFPEDFMFRLSNVEFEDWRSQIVTSNPAAKMGLRRKPYAFTEQGVAMLSGVLHSPRAVEVNIQIMRAFVRLRQLLSVHKELAERLAKLEAQMSRSRSRGCPAVPEGVCPIGTAFQSPRSAAKAHRIPCEGAGQWLGAGCNCRNGKRPICPKVEGSRPNCTHLCAHLARRGKFGGKFGP